MTKISQGLDLRQSQNLVMTPQLQQAIKMLQMNNAELTALVDEELAQNPFLEKADTDVNSKGDLEQNTDTASDYERDNIQSDSGTGDHSQEEFDEVWTGNEAASVSSHNTTQSFDHSSQASVGSGGNMQFDDADMAFENRMSKPETLRQHLCDQLDVAYQDDRNRSIGRLLIDQLDEAGYLRADVMQMAEQLSCSQERIEDLLNSMRGFDPTGVFASGLKECLALQLEERGQLDTPMKALLENLEFLGKRDFKKLCDICGVNETFLQDMIGEIQALNPKPASDYDHLVVQTAVPDVFMRKFPKNLGGGWRVELNNDTLPKVLINQEYYTQVAQTAVQKKDKDYLNSQLHSANWLVRSMDQRAQTILKVSAQIVELQDAFFNYGIEFLQPLTLKDIAEKIEMHESTVSRVTTNKYIGTPRGTYELKFFFSTAIGGQDGGQVHSSEAVKARIKILIDEEDPKKILSDDKIVALLKDEGIDLARRTVAKYREAMRIGSSVERRREKKV